MIAVDTLWPFIAATTLLALAPGPDNIFVLTQAVVNGSKAGFFVVLGLCTGLIVHTSAVALGVAAIIQSSPVAFTALKLLGAAYLLYLAWQAFRADGLSIDRDAGPFSKIALYRRGILMNVTNPKVAIFFLAFFPQFIVPQGGRVALQIFILGAIFMAVTLVVFGTVAMLSGAVRTLFLQTPKAQMVLNKLAGFVFIGLAAKILLGQR